MSKKMVEGRADSSPVKPTGSLTGLNEIFCVQIANTEKSIARAREELMEMLSELSDKALACVASYCVCVQLDRWARYGIVI